MKHEKFENHMREALSLAADALALGEVPVGCVISDERGEIIGRGFNRRETRHDACAHAEIEAISAACARLGRWNLAGCTLTVTLEPCPMCAGAIINSRISRVVYGAREPKSGSCGSIIDLFAENYGHRPAVYGGVMAEESAALLGEFFDKLRR